MTVVAATDPPTISLPSNDQTEGSTEGTNDQTVSSTDETNAVSAQMLSKRSGRRKIAPDAVCYAICLRFWNGQRDSLARMEELLDIMKEEHVKPNAECLSYAVYAYMQADQPEQAEEYYWQLLSLKLMTRDERGLVYGSTQHLLLA